MIVSENGTFLSMDLPKAGTSMAPMKTRIDKEDELTKRVRYQSQMKNERVLLDPTEFTSWKTKLN